jgi:ANTAR domain
MERQQVTDDEAFQILVRASQRLNIKLTAVAAQLAETGVSKTKDKLDWVQPVTTRNQSE